jgi:hypothetical protein
MTDLRYAFHHLLKLPLFTVVATLSLAVGVGAHGVGFTCLAALHRGQRRPYPRPTEGF